jgi:hypothetical protein
MIMWKEKAALTLKQWRQKWSSLNKRYGREGLIAVPLMLALIFIWRFWKKYEDHKDAFQFAAILSGLAFTGWQVLLTRKGQFTDRFSRALSLLTQTRAVS